MNEFIKKYEEDFNKVVEHFKSEISTIRTGRANPALLENIKVEVYGTLTPLNQVASIGVPESRCLTVEPWDKTNLKEIEKAIVQADLGVSVAGESTLVRVTVPQMTEENRQRYIKTLNEKLEKAKISARSVREKVKDEILAAEKNKEVTEDERYKFIEDLDKETNVYVGKLQDLADKKETEIKTI